MLTETQSRSTGKERDPETGLDYFGARYNASNMGRFMSPDPEQESGFLSMDDPQAWNGYAYARNNPLLYSDPDGMSYRVCDANGKNCYNFENDADYNKWLKDNNQVERGGGIYQKNPDESQTKLGTVEYYDRDVYAMLANVDRMAGTPVRALAWTTMGFVGGMMVVEAAPLAARAMRSGLQQATGQAQNTTLKEIIKRLYQTQDKIPGGTAGAIRDHLATGQWLSNSGHFIKAAERLTQLNRLIQSGTLSSGDLAIATAIAADLKNALGR